MQVTGRTFWMAFAVFAAVFVIAGSSATRSYGAVTAPSTAESREPAHSEMIAQAYRDHPGDWIYTDSKLSRTGSVYQNRYRAFCGRITMESVEVEDPMAPGGVQIGNATFSAEYEVLVERAADGTLKATATKVTKAPCVGPLFGQKSYRQAAKDGLVKQTVQDWGLNYHYTELAVLQAQGKYKDGSRAYCAAVHVYSYDPDEVAQTVFYNLRVWRKPAGEYKVRATYHKRCRWPQAMV
jgi:hypothetical protein